MGNTYPEVVKVAPGVTVNFERKPSVFNLTIQSNDTRSPPLYGYFYLLVTIVDVNEPSIWVSRTFGCPFVPRRVGLGDR
jgi:hypothetical protein